MALRGQVCSHCAALFDRYQRGVDVNYTPRTSPGSRAQGPRADRRYCATSRRRDALASTGKVGVIGYCWGATSRG
jgi:hypothetical protein